jgi:hypothetical protein
VLRKPVIERVHFAAQTRNQSFKANLTSGALAVFVSMIESGRTNCGIGLHFALKART